jgi:hypothetical protein
MPDFTLRPASSAGRWWPKAGGGDNIDRVLPANVVIAAFAGDRGCCHCLWSFEFYTTYQP